MSVPLEKPAAAGGARRGDVDPGGEAGVTSR